jgi:hypothetical protein
MFKNQILEQWHASAQKMTPHEDQDKELAELRARYVQITMIKIARDVQKGNAGTGSCQCTEDDPTLGPRQGAS